MAIGPPSSSGAIARVIAATLTLLALIGGLIGTAWQARVAREERARAEARFDDVRHLANASLFELHDAIRELPGATPARQLLVSKGMEYLDKLARDAGDRADLQRELAAGYLKLGDVLGRPFNPNLGDTTAASPTTVSRRPSTKVWRGGSPDATLRRELATAYLRLSEVLSSTGDTAEAVSFANKGLTLQTEGGSDAPLPADARRELVATYTRVGDLLSNTGDTTSALEHRRRALAMMEAVAATAVDDVANLRQLASSTRSSATRSATRTTQTSATQRADWSSSRSRPRSSSAPIGCIRTTRCSRRTWRSSTATPPTSCSP